jgi:glycosyltransferase involved in cell wall biosynthesis
MSQRLNVSSIVIAKNEEIRIAQCLAALSWCDEIILVDNGSTDATAHIAGQKGARVVGVKGRDFASLRNAGMKEAKGEWILYIDADETLTEDLRKEIQHVVGGSSIAAYELRRKNFYLGKEWPYQDKHLRLFRRDALKGWRGKLHETAIVEGDTAMLVHPLVHDTHRTLSEMVAKTNEWSDIEAKLRFDASHPPVVQWRLWRVMATAFFDSFVGQGGWRAGTVGWIESMYQAFSIFVTYAKLWELQQKS